MSAESAPPPKGESRFEERYSLDIAQRLPDFDTPGGNAYLLTDKEAPGRPLYGLVHHQTVPIRNEMYARLAKSPIPNLICPFDRGLMNLSLDGKVVQRLVTAFDRPTGGALIGKDGKVLPRVKAANIRQHVVLSALKALAALHKRGFNHRNMSVSGVFYASEDSEEIYLSECYSTPPGYRSPVAIEPLETAFCDSVARGNGVPASDFYQLGVILQSLYFGKDLTRERNRDSLLIARVNQGSYWALSGGQDVSGSLGVLVKGLMADEAEERWGAEDILNWYEGMAAQKRTSMRAWSMNRPTTFKGIAYVDRRLLADAFAKDTRDAAAFLRKIDFAAWVQLSMRDEILTERLDSAIGVSPGGAYGSANPSADTRMVARVCMFLHPTGPLRYKGLSISLDAIGECLADAYASDNRDRITALVEILDYNFLAGMVDIVGDKNPAYPKALAKASGLLEFVGSKQLGKGMERVLYTANPVLPCISQRFEHIWVGSLKQILGALDRLAEKGGARNILSDRHIASFIAAHGKSLDRELNKLAAAQNDPARFAVLSADFFALLQRMTKIPSLPHLTERMIDGLTPAVRSLRNKKRREKVAASLEKLKKGGDLTQVASDVNLLSISMQDAREFAQAKTTIFKLEREKTRLLKKVLPSDPEALRLGYRSARIVAGLVFVGVLFVTFSGA